MASALNPYTEDHIRHFRLLSVLLDLGTRTLRRKFEERLTDEWYTDLQEFLYTDSPNIDNDNSFCKAQRELLYPQGLDASIETFDISLLTSLILHYLSAYSQDGNKSVKHLLYLRNYLQHKKDVGIKQPDFISKWSGLRRHLVILDGDPDLSNEIDKYETKSFSDEEIIKLLQNFHQQLVEVSGKIDKLVSRVENLDESSRRKRKNSQESEEIKAQERVQEKLRKENLDESSRRKRKNSQESEEIKAQERVQEKLRKENLDESSRRKRKNSQESEEIKAQERVQEKLRKELRHHLVKKYQDLRYNIITALSGETFIIDVEDDLSLMPVEFSAEKLEKDERQQRHIKSEHVKVKYTNVDYNSIENLVVALGDEHESNVVQITANAGTGKTVAVHRLVCQWVSDCEKKQGLLGNQYNLVLFVALRDVNIDYSLLEMLCEGKNRLGYITSHKVDEVEKILQNPKTACKILILLDGLDEKTLTESSDIFQLITGKIYPDVKVLFTSRPEALILSKLNNLNPLFKVQVYGTTEEGVYTYLHRTIKASKKDVDNLIKQCELKMVDFQLFKIPIYLTIIGYVFDDYWSRNFTFKHFIVPDTVTKLFNIFMTVLLRVWLDKLLRVEEAAQLQFDTNPIDTDNQVPRDIRRILTAFAKLSFKSLLNEVYNFKDCDLKKYNISEQDISQCGMFCTSTSESPVYFFRHKQIQEYMGALFLSHEQCDDKAFTDIKEHIKTREDTLLHKFNKIQRVMPFLFGLAPKFAAHILHKLDGNICVVKRRRFINVNYEALLCAEACNQRVTELMGDLLISADIKEDDDYEFVTPISSVYKLCTGLSTTQHKTLLHNWYNLTLHKIEPESTNNMWDITGNNSETSVLELENVNEVLYFLLCNYTFPNVKSLTVKESYILHPGVILSVFPSLTRLVIEEGVKPVLDEDVVSVVPQCVTNNTSLTHLTVNAYDYITLQQCTVSSLLSLSQLTTLILHWADMLTELDVSCDIHLPQLHTLQMYMGKLTDTRWAGLTHLLTGTPQLTVFTLRCYNTLSTPQTVSLSQQLTTLPQLHTLVLYQVIQPRDMSVLCDKLQHMPGLVKLGLGRRDLEQYGGRDPVVELSQAVASAPHITHLYVVYDGYGDEDEAEAECVVESLRQHCPPHVQVNSYHWDISSSKPIQL